MHHQVNSLPGETYFASIMSLSGHLLRVERDGWRTGFAYSYGLTHPDSLLHDVPLMFDFHECLELFFFFFFLFF